ncbi:SH3 domain-containing protein [Actinomycetes bacterium KLBMP 9797]
MVTGPDRTRANEPEAAQPTAAEVRPASGVAAPSSALATAVTDPGGASVPLSALPWLQAGGNAAVSMYVARVAEGGTATAGAAPAVPAGQAIGKFARVGEVDPFLSVRTTMDPRQVTTLPDPLVVDALTFNDRVFVLERYGSNWAKVRTDRGEIGYAYADKLFIGAPDPQARIHKIKSGETALRIAQDTYNCGEWGRDGRFFVNVLVAVNQSGGDDKATRRGIFTKQGSDPGAIGSWKDAELRADYWIWLPSEAFARSLAGTVSSGSVSYEGWQLVKGLAGFAVGLFDGIGTSLVSLVTDVIDLAAMIVDLVLDVARKGIAAKVEQLREFFDKLDVVEIASAIWQDFEQRWKAADSYDRWNFRGFVFGMALAEIAMAVLSGGATAVVKIAAKAGKLAKFLAKVLKLDEVWDFVRGVDKAAETTEGGREARKLLRAGEPDADAPEAKGTADQTPDQPETAPGQPRPVADSPATVAVAKRLGIDLANLEPAPNSTSGRVFRPQGSGGHGAPEIRMADKLAAESGSDIVLPKQNNQAGIDGFYRDTGQPVQLKELPSAQPSKVVRRANDAFESARDHGWSNVDLQISAPNMTQAQVLARWNAANATPAVKPMPGGHIHRIQVRCSDGVLHLPVPGSGAPPQIRVPLVPGRDVDNDREES